jgi:Zn-dependent peptidase ImmA (M78 family)
MGSFKLEYRWLEPSKGVKSQVAHTWAEFSIYVDGDCITYHEDSMAKSVGDRVYIPLYYLAEWIASNWWNLVYQPLKPDNDSAGYYYTHKIKYARSGFSLPDLLIQPQGSEIFLQWRFTNLEYHKCRFLNSGFTTVDADEFRTELSEFVESVIERLEKNEVFDSQLQTNWQLISDSSGDEEEMDFCIAAAEAGIDPYDSSDENAKLIVSAYQNLPPSVFREFLYASNLETMGSDILALQNINTMIIQNNSDYAYIKDIRNTIKNKYEYTTPWMEGYNAARNIREKLGLNGAIVNSIEDLNGYFKTDFTKIEDVKKRPISSSIKLLVGANKNQSPVFVLPHGNPYYESNRKFLIARGLYEYFYGGDLSLVSSVDVESQKRNKAFAAEFLLPSATLRKRIKSQYISEDQIADLAEEFNISTKVVEHQIENHNIAQVGYY